MEKICVLLLAFLLPSSQGIEVLRLTCPLKWVLASNGDFPLGNIITFSMDDIVARMEAPAGSGTFLPARMNPFDGKAYASDGQGNVYENSQYEVLTNPDGCAVEWVEPKEGVETDNPFIGPGGFNFGKSHFTGEDGTIHLLGGGVKNATLYVALEGAEQKETEFEVLTSSLPLLNAHLFDIEYPSENPFVPNFVEVQESEIYICEWTTSEQGDHQIHHQGQIRETVFISEDEGWKGIEKVSQSLLPQFSGDQYTPNGGDVMLSRGENVTFSSNLRLGTGEKTQVCSGAMFYDTKGDWIPIEGKNQLTATGIDGDTVKRIVEDSGREVLDVSGDSVLVKFKGFMKGRFYLGKITYYDKFIDYPVPCYDILNFMIQKKEKA